MRQIAKATLLIAAFAVSGCTKTPPKAELDSAVNRTVNEVMNANSTPLHSQDPVEYVVVNSYHQKIEGEDAAVYSIKSPVPNSGPSAAFVTADVYAVYRGKLWLWGRRDGKLVFER